MKKNLILLGFMVCTMTMVGQTQKNEGWSFYVGGSYFSQVVATEFPAVGGRAALDQVYVGGILVSKKSITGSFGEGFRYGGGAEYRFSNYFGLQMSVNYFKSNSKTMVQTSTDLPGDGVIYNLKADGQLRALDLAPVVVFYLGEAKGFNPYAKVGVIVPVNGYLEIKTTANPFPGMNVAFTDKINPNPTAGFVTALGTTYKIGKNIAVYAELEYRNFTIEGKDKETTAYTVNGIDMLSTRTAAQRYSNYTDHLDGSSNNSEFNVVDPTKPKDELSSYVGISGLGLTLGLKYNL